MSGGEGSFLGSDRDADSDREGVRLTNDNQSKNLRRDHQQNENGMRNISDETVIMAIVESKHEDVTQKDIVDLTDDHTGPTRGGRTHLSYLPTRRIRERK